ncbi:MAG: tRNA preQ1(34) S-adenosylmethionine ribosyltransferase-isomerase QueA [Candidatus Omnitrophica bacterium]|nr:tRNA preQ1(34) S-adenosylmethionine ribosyltransferase-isomerase QueA [Candidatus Omnitrophota bacterium]
MDLQDFVYDLPKSLIAQHPLPRRDHARLMVIDRAAGTIRHSRFDELEAFLPQKSFFILNDSKVIPARLFGRKERSDGMVEIFLLKKLIDGYTYEALLRPAKKIRSGDRINFEKSSLYATIVDVDARLVKFNYKNIMPHIQRIGHIPLPPYIRRDDEKSDHEFYQTVYAKNAGSVAAPTAGLHFTKPHLRALEKNGHKILRTTLHVNYATFKAVEEEDVTKHHMHYESYEISAATLRKIKANRAENKKAIAVGTTSCRVIESVAKTGILKGETNLFIYPGYQFRMTDALLTNFHLPYSSLLMLVFAFGGMDLLKRAYNQAIEKKYRFFSYGDCMLLL